ncbi:MAG: ribokinase [Trueperaceae bacterium]|nr:ribokinase [Trueperaceae bacterium]
MTSPTEQAATEQPAAKIAVLGSLNVDLVTRLEHFPQPGQTLSAESFSVFAGGKGANQAAACGRLGAQVAMYGALGTDELAGRLDASLQENHVDVNAVRRLNDVATGTASIWVDATGENAIAIAAGANARVDQDYADGVIEKLNAAAYLLIQLEIPLDTMAYVLKQLADDGPKVILDPAPAQDLSRLPTERIWLLTPNEHELASLADHPTDSADAIRNASAKLSRALGLSMILCKAGARGAYLFKADEPDDLLHIPGYDVDVVDTTAAGDAFNGALAVALAEDRPMHEAIAFANAAGALCVTREGAQPAMPSRDEVANLMRR